MTDSTKTTLLKAGDGLKGEQFRLVIDRDGRTYIDMSKPVPMGTPPLDLRAEQKEAHDGRT